MIDALWLAAGALPVALLCAVFYRRQQRGALGGGMSVPKAYWLGLVVYLWFWVCPVAAWRVLQAPWALSFQIFSVNMFLRGAVELFMLGVTKNWRPRYGITHNTSSLCLIVVMAAGAPWAYPGLLVVGLALAVFVSLVMETYHAAVFTQLVDGKTTGDDGVWFANAAEPKFRRINRVTMVNNWVLSAIVLASLVGAVLQEESPQGALAAGYHPHAQGNGDE